MELKSVQPMGWGPIETSFNRTFMELKFIISIVRKIGYLVLIVPLWN